MAVTFVTSLSAGLYGLHMPDWLVAYTLLRQRRHGVIVYRKELPVGALIGGGMLDFGQPVHDYAQASSSGLAWFNCCQASCMQASKEYRSL